MAKQAQKGARLSARFPESVSSMGRLVTGPQHYRRRFLSSVVTDGVEKVFVIFLANSDFVCWRHSAAEVCHDGSADGRSEPTVLFVQSRKPYSGRPSAASDQSDRGAGAG